MDWHVLRIDMNDYMITNPYPGTNIPIKPFYATGLFRYPLKTSQNQRLSDIFRY